MSAQEETVSTETPVTAPVAAGETPAVDASAPTDQATERDEKGRFRNPVQPRIDELTRKNHEKDRENAYLRARLEAHEKPKVEAPVKPTPDKFDDYGAYVEALADWKADEKVKAAREEDKAERARERENEQRQSTWAERAQVAKTRHADYDAVMSESDVPIADFVMAALRESERGPELAYQLAKDPSIADKLNAMTPARAAIELGRMEAKLPELAVSAEPDPEEVPDVKAKAAAPAAPPRKTTSAPPPIKPIAKGASTAVDLNKLSGEDYVAARKAQGATWARR
jgi:hypothetical protein